MSLSLIDWKKWLFAIVIISYAIALPLYANFGVVDDHQFLTTLLSNQKLDFYISPSIGRFLPLDGQEYNIISFVSLSPSAFYAYNMIQFVIVVFGLFKILELCLGGGYTKYLGYGIVLLVVLSPGFVEGWFRLYVPERNAFVFFLLFLISYLLFERKQKLSYLITGLVAANIALYYKEPGFVMLGAFGFFHLVFAWNTLNLRQKLFDALLIGSASIFIAFYYYIVFLKRGAILYGDTPYNPVITFAKNVAGYFLSDPFLMVLLFGLLAYRAYEVVIKKNKLEPVYDAALLAGALYVLVFLKLNIGAYRYLLPAYVFATLGLVHFFVGARYVNKSFLKPAVFISLALYFTSALPVAIHLISLNKSGPNNFTNALAFLTDYINRDGRRVAIYLDGVNRGSGLEVYRSLEIYLLYKGLNANQFDLKSDSPSDNSLLFSQGESTNPFTVFRDPGATQIEAGNLLIVTPYTFKFVDEKYLHSLEEYYELLYHAESTWVIPNIGLKSLAKYYVMRLRNVPSSNNEVMRSSNVFVWPDYYIFRRRTLGSNPTVRLRSHDHDGHLMQL